MAKEGEESITFSDMIYDDALEIQNQSQKVLFSLNLEITVIRAAILVFNRSNSYFMNQIVVKCNCHCHFHPNKENFKLTMNS